MKILRKIPIEAANFLLNALIALPFAVVYFTALDTHDRLGHMLIVMSPIVLAHLTGRLTRKLPQPYIIFPVMAATVAAVVWLMNLIYTGDDGNFIVTVGLCVGGSVALFFYARAQEPDMGPIRYIIGIIGYLAAFFLLFFTDAPDEYKTLVNIFGITYFLLGLFMLNRFGLKRAIRYGELNRNATKYPAGMRRGNTFVLAVFALISLVVAGFDLLREGVTRIVTLVVGGFFGFFWWISQLVTQDRESVPGMGFPEFDGILAELDLENSSRGSMFVVLIIVFIIAAIILSYVLYRLIRFVRRTVWPWLLALIRRLIHPGQDMDYTDEDEDLFDWKQFRQNVRKRVRGVMSAFTRKLTFADQPDTRAKVRFTYKRLLTKLVKTTPRATAMTPSELELEDGSKIDGNALDAFVGVYNEVRYSDHDLPEEAETVAKKVYDSI